MPRGSKIADFQRFFDVTGREVLGLSETNWRRPLLTRTLQMGENRRAWFYRYGKFIRMDHGFVTKPDYIRVTQTTLASSTSSKTC